MLVIGSIPKQYRSPLWNTGLTFARWAFAGSCAFMYTWVSAGARDGPRLGKTRWEKKKRLINSYPFELSRGELDRNWMLLHSQAVTNVSDVPKNNNNSSSNCCHSVWARLTLRPRLFFIGGCSFFFFSCAEGREDDRQQQEHSKVLVSETASPVEVVQEFNAVFFSHDLNSLHLKSSESIRSMGES